MRSRGNLRAAIIAEARSCRHAGISTITQGAGAAGRPTNPTVATAPWAPPGPNPVVSLEPAELGQALDLWAHAGASHDADQTPPTRPTRERAAAPLDTAATTQKRPPGPSRAMLPPRTRSTRRRRALPSRRFA